MEYGGSGAIADYTYGIGLISQQRGSVTSFYHVDGLGSTRYLTDVGGVVTDAYRYDAYGSLLGSSGSTMNSYLFTGEQFDRNLGEYYLRARYYSPGVGRFTARDPFDGWLSDPLSLNKYGYVHGNPVNSIDPTGMFTMSEISATLNLQSLAVTTLYVMATTGTWGNKSKNLAQQHRLLFLGLALRSANLASETEFDNYGIPIMFSGSFSGGKSIEITTLHIWSAIVEKGITPILSKWPGGNAPSGHGMHVGRNRWFDNKSECDKSSIRQRYLRSQLTCDEYPFYSTYEGGENNYTEGKVSLMLVPEIESGPQGRLIGLASRAGVQAGVPFLDTYGVVSLPFFNQSYWKDSGGNKIYP